MPKAKTKFAVGDKVTFVNDSGVRFTDKTITKIEVIGGEDRFYYSPSSSPWFPCRERNLRKAD